MDNSRITLRVQGMCSDHCALTVRKIILSHPSVDSADTSFANEEAVIVFKNNDQSDLDAILKEIRAAGYEPTVQQAHQSQEHAAHDGMTMGGHEHHAAENLKRKVIVGLFFSALSLVFMVSDLLGRTIVSSHMVSFLQFLFASPVVLWAGRHFYTSAWAKARYRIADMDTLIALGTGVAYLYSLVALIVPQWFEQSGIAPQTYFDSATYILTLILLGQGKAS